MTIEEVVKRFLKDNGLYGYVIRNKRKYFYLGGKRFIVDNAMLDRYIVRYNLRDLFYHFYSSSAIFVGNGDSPQRRKFYRYNKKWKDYIKQFVVQHNICAGDNVEFTNFFGAKRKGVVKDDLANEACILNVGLEEGYSMYLSIFLLSVKDKETIINFYQKDDNGINYGKLEGEYNEIQLQ